MSSKFKTQSKFGFQPVTTNSVSHELIKRYTTEIRPQIACKMENRAINDDDYSLFVRYDGKPHKTGGSMVGRCC